MSGVVTAKLVLCKMNNFLPTVHRLTEDTENNSVFHQSGEVRERRKKNDSNNGSNFGKLFLCRVT